MFPAIDAWRTEQLLRRPCPPTRICHWPRCATTCTKGKARPYATMPA